MNGFNGMQILMMVITLVSFWGLCIFTKERFKLDAAVAPFATACGIMVLLMLGGMARILLPMWYILFIGGYAQLGYSCIVRRKHSCKKWEWMPVVTLAVALAYGLWRFSGEYYVGNDTFSHWGLAAKYLVGRDCFPDKTTDIIYFQSYPLGITSFIYYFVRLAGWNEGLSLCVFFMLNAIAFLPVAGSIKKHYVLGYVLTALGLLFIVCFGVPVNQMQVDTMMGIMAVGSVASLYRHRDSEIRVVGLAMLYSAMFIFVKSSGIFFSVIITVCAVYFVIGNRGKKAVVLRAVILTALTIAAAYFIWNTHVKLAYEGGLNTKHAVSISNYAQEVKSKESGAILSIAGQMIMRLIKPMRMYLLMAAVAVLFAAGMGVLITGREEKSWKSLLKHTILMCVAVFVVWYIMLFLMYVFSMPIAEASRLASIIRYERTVYGFIIGIGILFFMAYFFREDVSFSFFGKKTRIAVVLLGLAALGFGTAFLANDDTYELVVKMKTYGDNQYVAHIRENYKIEDEKKYIVLFDSEKRDPYYVNNVLKYDRMSNDMMFVCKGMESRGLDTDSYYAAWDKTSTTVEYAKLEGIPQMLDEKAAQYDYILVLDEDPNYESALAEYQIDHPDVQIAYGY